MAATYRFYRTPRIGDGSIGNPYRSKLDNYITGGNGEFYDLINDARPVRYALAICEPIIHAQIAADAEITALSPERVDVTAMQTWLGGTAIGLSQTIQDVLEGDGISVAWIAQQTTLKQLLQFLTRWHVCVQDLKRLKNAESLDFFNRALTLNVSAVPANVRNKVQNWMINKGLDTSWIVGSTKVRAVVQYILDNLDWPILNFGPMSLQE